MAFFEIDPRAGASYDTEVLTSTGPRALGDVAVGDEVWTHRGRRQRVEALVGSAEGPLLQLALHGGEACAVAPGAGMWARVALRHKSQRRLGRPSFVAAGSLRRKDRLGQYVPPEVDGSGRRALVEALRAARPLDRAALLRLAEHPPLWELLGAWLVYGSAPRGAEVVRVSLRGDMPPTTLRGALASAGGGEVREVVHELGRRSLVAQAPALRRVAEHLGVDPAARRLPGACLTLEAPLRDALLAGMYGATPREAPLRLRSRELALGARRLLLAAGLFASVAAASPGGRPGARPRWTVRVCRRPPAEFDPDARTWWTCLAAVTPVPPGPTVSLAVDGDSSFCSLAAAHLAPPETR